MGLYSFLGVVCLGLIYLQPTHSTNATTYVKFWILPVVSIAVYTTTFKLEIKRLTNR